MLTVVYARLLEIRHKHMPILEILKFPDARLRTKAKPVDEVNDSIKQLTEDMLETMYNANGIGLAATQVNVHKQVVVMDLSEERDQPLVMINPKLTVMDEELQENEEGCLSVPGFYETVERPRQIRLNALDADGNAFELEPEGLLSICIQHEIDHLGGKLFVDHISAIKRTRIRKKIEKQQRQHSAQ